MEPAQLLPYIGWIVAAAFTFGIGCVLASVHTTRLKIKNGYPLKGMWGQSLKPTSSNESLERIKLLTQENAALRAEVSAVKERLANVERIVTDGGFALTHQIEALRDSGRDKEGVN